MCHTLRFCAMSFIVLFSFKVPCHPWCCPAIPYWPSPFFSFPACWTSSWSYLPLPSLTRGLTISVELWHLNMKGFFFRFILVPVGSMFDDIRLRVARPYTSSPDSPFSRYNSSLCPTIFHWGCLSFSLLLPFKYNNNYNKILHFYSAIFTDCSMAL